MTILASEVLNRFDGWLVLGGVGVAVIGAYLSWEFMLTLACMALLAAALGVAWNASRLTPDGHLQDVSQNRARGQRPWSGRQNCRVEVVTDAHDERLADYRALTDVELRTRFEPPHGLFIAEGELVLRRALRGRLPAAVDPGRRQAAGPGRRPGRRARSTPPTRTCCSS